MGTFNKTESDVWAGLGWFGQVGQFRVHEFLPQEVNLATASGKAQNQSHFNPAMGSSLNQRLRLLLASLVSSTSSASLANEFN